MAVLEYLEKIEKCTEEELSDLESKEAQQIKNLKVDTETESVLKRALQGTVQTKFESIRALRSSLKTQNLILAELQGKKEEDTKENQVPLLQDSDETECDQSSQELLVPEAKEKIFKVVGKFDLWELENLSEEEKQEEYKHVKVVEYEGNNLARFIEKVSEEVKIIKDLHIVAENNDSQESEAVMNSLKTLKENHEEMDSIHLTLKVFTSSQFLLDMISYTGQTIKSLEFGYLGFELPYINKESLPNLERLVFEESDVPDFQLRSILKTVEDSLVELKFKNEERVTGENLAASNALKKLATLELDSCKHISNSGLADLLSISPNIRSLKLSCLDASGEGTSSSNLSLKQLTSLELRKFDGLSDHGLAALLSVFPNLRTLKMNGLPISGEGIDNSSLSLVKLTRVEIEECKNLSDRGLARLLALAQNLRTIIASDLNITGEGFTINRMEKLTCLELSKCENLSDLALAQLPTATPNLQSLKISDVGITGLGLGNVPVSLQKLSNLQIAGEIRLHEEGLAGMLSIMPNLESVSFAFKSLDDRNNVINNCKPMDSLRKLTLGPLLSITDESLGKLLTIMPQLQSLHLAQVERYYAAGDSDFSLPTLTSLSLTGWRTLPEDDLGKLVSIFPNLQEMSVSSQLDIFSGFLKNLESRGITVRIVEEDQI